ncbi:hypothetical protein V8B97DRAFT_2109947 [Scleroderma yunnanense]
MESCSVSRILAVLYTVSFATSLNHKPRPITGFLLRLDFSIVPDVRWDKKIHSSAETFLILVEGRYTEDGHKDFYKQFLVEGLPIELHLPAHLLDDFLLSEIAVKTVANEQDAMVNAWSDVSSWGTSTLGYFTWTYFYHRTRENPNILQTIHRAGREYAASVISSKYIAIICSGSLLVLQSARLQASSHAYNSAGNEYRWYDMTDIHLLTDWYLVCPVGTKESVVRQSELSKQEPDTVQADSSNKKRNRNDVCQLAVLTAEQKRQIYLDEDARIDGTGVR